jgi:hypothetical protein
MAQKGQISTVILVIAIVAVFLVTAIAVGLITFCVMRSRRLKKDQELVNATQSEPNVSRVPEDLSPMQLQQTYTAEPQKTYRNQPSSSNATALREPDWTGAGSTISLPLEGPWAGYRPSVTRLPSVAERKPSMRSKERNWIPVKLHGRKFSDASFWG